VILNISCFYMYFIIKMSGLTMTKLVVLSHVDYVHCLSSYFSRLETILNCRFHWLIPNSCKQHRHSFRFRVETPKLPNRVFVDRKHGYHPTLKFLSANKILEKAGNQPVGKGRWKKNKKWCPVFLVDHGWSMKPLWNSGCFCHHELSWKPPLGQP